MTLELNSFCDTRKRKIKRDKLINKNYSDIKKSLTLLNRSLSRLSKNREWLSDSTYKLYIDHEGIEPTQSFTLRDISNHLQCCLPKKPTHIESKHIKALFESIRWSCEKAIPNIRWYTRSGYTNEITSPFFQICKFLAQKIAPKLSDETYSKYIQNTVKPNTKAMERARNRKKLSPEADFYELLKE